MTDRMTYDIIDTSKGGEAMSRHKKDREWDVAVKLIVLLTVAIELVTKIIELLNKLFE